MEYSIIRHGSLRRTRLGGVVGWVLLIVCLCGLGVQQRRYSARPKTDPHVMATVVQASKPVEVSISSGVLKEFVMRYNSKIYGELAEKIVKDTERIAKQYKLSPAIVLAVQAAESQFYPFAVSNRSAKGLMQLNLDANGNELRAKGIIRNPSDEFDPSRNIEGGCYLLRKFVTEEGSLDKALNRYLGGSSAAYKADVHKALGQILVLEAERESGIK